jgi:hypothetical protein
MYIGNRIESHNVLLLSSNVFKSARLSACGGPLRLDRKQQFYISMRLPWGIRFFVRTFSKRENELICGISTENAYFWSVKIRMTYTV